MSDRRAATKGGSGQDDAGAFELQQLRAMEQPSWNEGRLDDLKSTVDQGFERMDRGFERIDRRIDRMQWMLFSAAAGIIIALIGAPHL